MTAYAFFCPTFNPKTELLFTIRVVQHCAAISAKAGLLLDKETDQATVKLTSYHGYSASQPSRQTRRRRQNWPALYRNNFVKRGRARCVIDCHVLPATLLRATDLTTCYVARTMSRCSLQHDALVERQSVTLGCTQHVSTYVWQRGCAPRVHSFSVKQFSVVERQIASRDEGATAAADDDVYSEWRQWRDVHSARRPRTTVTCWTSSCSSSASFCRRADSASTSAATVRTVRLVAASLS